MFKAPLISLLRRLHTLNASQRKRALIWSAGTSLAVAVAALIFHPPEIVDLSEEGGHKLPRLLARWENGDVIVLLRHLERCDKEDYPCLEGTKGVTSRSVAVGNILAGSFAQLGLGKTDIYNSPLTRTAQTEAIVFDDVGVDEDWLYKCRETMVHDALQNKMPNKNLILVTHSSCISAFEQELGYDSDTPAYGTSLFFSESSKRGSLDVLGFLDAEDWSVALSSQGQSVGQESPSNLKSRQAAKERAHPRRRGEDNI
ncbi:histidine phosphatase family protein [Pseudomonas sp. Q2-TVG4-2]|uniref:lipopolysaccharide core heptose(II)-phosphate phosphatase PmrG n=1 Tax=Pseudomonas sp. Q2-TVG4-2 TaxID=1685699 RepID=UPI0015E67CD6|nr:histidine phosphatase family protein [Pseudomonas sp. Q2-TVG4-2]